MMILSEKSLWVRVYNTLCELSNRLGDGYIDKNKISQFSANIDICKFARRFLVWAPITIGIYAIYYVAIFGMIYLLFRYVGFAQVSISIGWGLVYITSFIGIMLAVGYTCDFIKRKNSESEDKEPGVVKTWYKAVKSKTCTFMEISE